MTGRLKPYSEYKDSGLPWLRQIPAHWEVRRNGRLFVERIETGYPHLPILEVSLRTGVRVRDLDNARRKQVMSNRAGYKRALSGDVAYNMMRMWQGAVGVVPEAGLVSPAYVVARPFPEVDSRYYAYLFRTAAYMREVDTYSRGIVSDRNRLYWEEFKQMPSCFPPNGEQTAIADYLDRHGALVRRYIRNRRGLIELLNERKQAIITQAVTRGLDPSVRLKPSDIDWLGDIPEHWEVRRLKIIARIRYGLGQPPKEKTSGLPLIRATNVHRGKVIDKGMLYVDETDVPISRDAFLREAEIIVVRSGAYTADSAIIPKKYVGAVAGYDMVVSVRDAKPEFVALVLLCKYVLEDQLFLLRSRAAQPHLNAEELGNTLILVPPISEQREMVHVMEQRFTDLDTALGAVQREIDLIREYRERLIADVVTGKLDVRGVTLPEIGEDEAAEQALQDLEEVEDDAETEEAEEDAA